MEDVIRIQCPSCSTVINLKNGQGYEKMSLTCPICKRRHPFTSYKKLGLRTNPTGWQQPQQPQPNIQSRPVASNIQSRPVVRQREDSTQLGSYNSSIGKLILLPMGITYQLKEGFNTIGRKSGTSKAGFQIDTGGRRGMSREHVAVEVVKEKFKGYVHYISLCKESVNPTTINGQKLKYGVDRMILNHRDIIRLPDAELRFELPDDDETQLM